VENRISQGEIYFVHLDPTFGREIGGYKVRPVLVVSINDIHQRTRIVAVVPGTTTVSAFPNVVRIDRTESNRLPEATYFQCHQIRAVDQGRMTSGPIGRVSRADFERVQEALRLSLGLYEKP
jgi:mRNA-degrading endonuclease toxin of MazEF toxin-antitoxin module